MHSGWWRCVDDDLCTVLLTCGHILVYWLLLFGWLLFTSWFAVQQIDIPVGRTTWAQRVSQISCLWYLCFTKCASLLWTFSRFAMLGCWCGSIFCVWSDICCVGSLFDGLRQSYSFLLRKFSILVALPTVLLMWFLRTGHCWSLLPGKDGF